MNILEKAEHALRSAIINCLRRLNDDEPEKAIELLQSAQEPVNEVPSVVLQIEGKVVSLGRIIPEASSLIKDGKNDEVREFLREVQEALSPKS